jgi:hypothetical protein
MKSPPVEKTDNLFYSSLSRTGRIRAAGYPARPHRQHVLIEVRSGVAEVTSNPGRL